MPRLAPRRWVVVSGPTRAAWYVCWSPHRANALGGLGPFESRAAAVKACMFLNRRDCAQGAP